ncbi:MAG: transketolase [Cardiobacteriaceae bacterium]|nr:transketolase [Cardiobacteriaceae bacterium]
MTEKNYQLIANAIRGLSMDIVQKANSGHPGAPLGMAEMAAVLWRGHLRVNPKNPAWENRDRFVLSNGHASALQYSLLHLCGFDLTLDDLQNFRQLGSRTPGHPEYRETAGVETTTGPLGQGIANAVGFAIAEKTLAAQFNRADFEIVDHYSYCFVGDGCLMEGVASEACSLAGTLELGKLIVFYDANGISIDGKVEGWFNEDVAARFRAYGWQVIGAIDGHNPEEIDQAIRIAKDDKKRPSLIICRTVIGKGSAKFEGSEKSHGAPFGQDEITATKKALNLPSENFALPEGAKEAADLSNKGEQLESEWKALFVEYEHNFPELAAEYKRRVAGKLPEDFAEFALTEAKNIQAKAEKIATRKASENAINIFAAKLPELLGGSADLTGSNLTAAKTAKTLQADDFSGNYLRYGVREFAMAAVMNGIILHGGFRPFGGTFLVFSDYMRNGIRMSALMGLPVIYVLTHDSIGLGEDGPTHQPIEHISSLRLIPNLQVWRPADATETLVAWQESLLNKETPAAFALSRQNLPTLPRTEAQIESISRGGYVLKNAENPQAVLIATGSEVEIAMQAADKLAEENIAVKVVSMPCWEVFAAQDKSYQSEVLPENLPRIAIEAGSTAFWRGIVGFSGKVVGIDTFGSSAPAAKLFEKYEITIEKIVASCKETIA